jgi:predicted RNA binding protein YcfA (HicA-like mRNA interferase family)
MKLPRGLSAKELIKALGKLGYVEVRQTGSHIRLVCESDNNHHITIPFHDPLRVGTLSAILSDIAKRRGLTKDELISNLFDM